MFMPKEFKAAETKGVQVSMAIKNAALSFVSYFTRTARAAGSKTREFR